MKRTYYFWPLMMWWAVVMHLGYGPLLILNPAVMIAGVPAHASDLAILGGLNVWIDAGLPAWLVGVGVSFFAALAGVGLYREHHASRREMIILIGPQYVILVVAIAADIWFFASGHYMGRPIDRVILYGASWPLFTAQIMHTVAVFERLVLRWVPPATP